jgi:hypothetical protein
LTEADRFGQHDHAVGVIGDRIAGIDRHAPSRIAGRLRPGRSGQIDH